MTAEVYEAGDIVQVLKKPAGCCGVIRQGWWGKVISVVEVFNDKTYEEEQILILEDTTLVWGHEVVPYEGSTSIS